VIRIKSESGEAPPPSVRPRTKCPPQKLNGPLKSSDWKQTLDSGASGAQLNDATQILQTINDTKQMLRHSDLSH